MQTMDNNADDDAANQATDNDADNNDAAADVIAAMKMTR
jgi:hypothetical protein